MPWFQRDKERYRLEVKLLKKHFPNARVVIYRGRLVIFHKVRGKFNQYLVRIIYPKNFPHSQSWQVKVVKPEISGAPHQFKNGSLCLFAPNQVSSQTSGKIIADWSKRWVKAYEKWRDAGKWPSFKTV